MLHFYPAASLFLEYWPLCLEKSGLERRASSQAFCQGIMTLQRLRSISCYLSLASVPSVICQVEKGLGQGAHLLNVSSQGVK